MTNYGWSAIKSDGTLWAWGGNYDGQLGVKSSRWSSMTANIQSSPVQLPGTETTWAILADGNAFRENGGVKTDGTLWAWGRNLNGTLGQNSTSADAYSSPVQVPGTTWSTDAQKFVIAAYASVQAIKTDGTLWDMGRKWLWWKLRTQSNKSCKTFITSTNTWYILNGHPCLVVDGFKVYAIKTDGTLMVMGI